MQMQAGAGPSATPYHPAAVALQGLFTLANETERELARGMGINLTDFRALSALERSGPVTVGKLAEDLGATPATTTAIVNRLESRGYVARHRGADDRRQVQVSTTPESSKGIMALMRPLMTATDQHLKALPAAQQSAVADFLDVARHLMRDHLRTLSERDSQ
ncbi:DNA-binding MarR family transcriptional regulator [Arthrobacter sp. PvP023]|uniref:MarR family winged helix-turn-helix transcriptional regulator n=1 Tax=Micrococcaceae TaxID=1268 RepID=UPI001AE94CAB|nr:MarR family transcriptional regulator [Arthrobacter sp. PvP023]MBP1137373.1 DNA-binding MarR family transcriptional regulator [Arthrobacter sp. PvP023]